MDCGVLTRNADEPTLPQKRRTFPLSVGSREGCVDLSELLQRRLEEQGTPEICPSCGGADGAHWVGCPQRHAKRLAKLIEDAVYIAPDISGWSEWSAHRDEMM
jgi:hypothetical protein